MRTWYSHMREQHKLTLTERCYLNNFESVKDYSDFLMCYHKEDVLKNRKLTIKDTLKFVKVE